MISFVNTNPQADATSSAGGTPVTAFRIRWLKQPGRSPRGTSLRAINARMSKNYSALVRRAESNTRRLTGKPTL
jgi:hypothetical protein